MSYRRQIIVIISPMLRVYVVNIFLARHCMLQYSRQAEPHSVFTRQYILIFTLRIPGHSTLIG